MLAIRMQRTGRKGYPMYRVIVQEAHRQPTSGKVVANLGSYNPHTKQTTLDKDKAATYLKNGAQPSDRVVKLLQVEKVDLPAWVNVTSDKKQKTIKTQDKLRRNRAPEPVEETPEVPVDETEAATAETDQPVEAPADEAVEQAPATEEAATPAPETAEVAEETPAEPEQAVEVPAEEDAADSTDSIKDKKTA